MITTEVVWPSVVLRPFVHHYWILKANQWGMSRIPIMPVGCMRWMFHRKRPFCVEGVASEDKKTPVGSLMAGMGS